MVSAGREQSGRLGCNTQMPDKRKDGKWKTTRGKRQDRDEEGLMRWIMCAVQEEKRSKRGEELLC